MTQCKCMNSIFGNESFIVFGVQHCPFSVYCVHLMEMRFERRLFTHNCGIKQKAFHEIIILNIFRQYTLLHPLGVILFPCKRVAYIFERKPTNSRIIWPLFSSFITPITFLLCACISNGFGCAKSLVSNCS